MAVATHKTVEPTIAPVDVLQLPHPNSGPDVAPLLRRQVEVRARLEAIRVELPQARRLLQEVQQEALLTGADWHGTPEIVAQRAAIERLETENVVLGEVLGPLNERTRVAREAATAMYNDAVSKGLRTELRALYAALEPLQARYARLRELDLRLMSIQSGGPRGIIDETLPHRLSLIRDYLGKFTPEP